ncbi:MAG TPA: hypothetical protein VJ928_02675 [Marivita sp.]|nr:hypothetical protein [Marivita sp.]
MTILTDQKSAYQACHARSFRAEFGVFRGDAISRVEDLNLGDIYTLKPDTDWVTVQTGNPDTTTFSRSVAANLPVETLTTLANLIFMTTTGRRVDVFATVSMGQVYLVSTEALAQRTEYVLIDIELLDPVIRPVVVPAQMAKATTAESAPSNVIPFKAVG